jgi:CRP-like cAMP-binding protein
MSSPPAALHPFFHGLSEENQVLLARVTQHRQVAAGQFLFQQGDPADTALFIERGRVELDVRLPGGGHLALPPSNAGSVLGELALVERHRRSATARVVEEMEALEMHRDDLRALCAVRHPASLSMLRRLARLVATRLLEVNAERAPQRSADTHVVCRADWQPGAPFDLSRFLPVLPLFANFSQADIQTVLDAAEVWTIGAAQPIALYDDPPGGCFVVLRGAVEAVAPTPHGARRLAVFGPGAPVGILSALLARPRSATWVARERATVLELPTEALAALRDPRQRASFRFYEAVLRALIQRLEQATRALTGERRLQPVV